MTLHVDEALTHLLRCRAELRAALGEWRGTPREAEIRAVLVALRAPTEALLRLSAQASEDAQKMAQA